MCLDMEDFVLDVRNAVIRIALLENRKENKWRVLIILISRGMLLW